jgi:hypothetical protein
MALNVKPLYPFDHPEVTHPEMEVDRTEPTAVKNKYEPTNDFKNQTEVEYKPLEINLIKRLDIL